MRTRLSAVLLFVTAASLAAQDPAQRDAQQPTFRTGANYVRVDMYATQDGKTVGDLRLEEVEVLEDGVLQKIEAFEHVQLPRASPQETRVEPDGLRASREAAADPRARVFVLFLDTYHTQLEGSAMMRRPLVNFLDRVLGPDDLIALMTPEMGATDIAFTRKTAVLENILSEEWWGKRATVYGNDSKDDLYEQCGSVLNLPLEWVEELKARRREKLTLDALSDLVTHLNGVREERKAVVVVTEGWLLYREKEELARVDPQRGPISPPFLRPPVPPTDEKGMVNQPMMIECEADRLALARIDHDQKLRELGEDANRGNVTFYPVYARGLSVFDAPIGPDPPPNSRARTVSTDVANLATRQTAMRNLAIDTDGEAIVNTNNIDRALQRIVDDLSSYYLLGYYTTNAKLDGRFRSITVRVKRPGVRVRARRGYRGRTAEDLLTGGSRAPNPAAEAVTSAVNRMAATTSRTTFRIRPASWSRTIDGGTVAGTAWVIGELDFRTRKELAWTAGAQAEVVVLAADGTQVTTSTVNIPAAQGAFGILIPEEGTLASGDYAVRVRLRSEADTDIVLSDTLRLIVPAAASNMGEAVMWRRGPTTGTQHLRTADARFQRSDRIRLELPATGEGSATARMLDRLGNPMFVPVRVSERPDPSGQFRWIVAEATLAPLTNGDYAIEVVLGASKQVTAFRVVP
jgi:VWFA-related protein